MILQRKRSQNRDKVHEVYKDYGGNITNRENSNLLGEDEKMVVVWKTEIDGMILRY